MASHERAPASIHGHDESHDRPVTTAEEDRSTPTGGVRPRVEQYSTVQWSTVQSSAFIALQLYGIQHSPVQPSPVHCITVYSTAQSSRVQGIALPTRVEPARRIVLERRVRAAADRVGYEEAPRRAADDGRYSGVPGRLLSSKARSVRAATSFR